ncbi:hypothetical protein LSAT2_000902 [Lamellibrachia satsuma]|nr:hypothetical protein LSAT2_000902 [Lamellibrachia satsuma]
MMVKTRSHIRAGKRNDEVRELFPSKSEDRESDVDVGSEVDELVQGPESSESGGTSWLWFAGASVFIACLSVSAAFLYSWIGPDLSDAGALFDYHWTYSRRFGMAAFLGCALVSALLGLGCCAFSYTITYFDSMQPGHNPPTPMSPRLLRKQSGHDFHTGYAMSVLNGAAFFSYCLWSLRGYFWMTSET